MTDQTGDVHFAEGFPGDPIRLFERMALVAADPLYALDGDRTFVAVNEALVAFTGYTAEALLGRSIGDLLANPSGMRALELMTAKVADDGSTLAGEFELRTADGNSHLCELEVAALDPGGHHDAIVGTARDVTGDRRREERLEVLDRVLRHNLRNKIGTVLGYLDLLIDEAESSGDTEMAETAREEARELLAISNKARRFDRLLEIEPTRTTVADLGAVVDPVVERARREFPAATVDVEVAEHDQIVVDAELIEAALEEVIGNAILHNDGPDPSVVVTVEQVDDRVDLRVEDDGPGIGEEERTAILSGEEEPLYHASGLGIWMVKWCLQLTGGRLDIDDNEPTGTVVTLSFPVPASAMPDGA